MKKSLLLIAFSVLYTTTDAQTATWNIVYNVFQNKCSTCHGGGSPAGQLNLSGNSTTVYNAIINKAPVNPAAAARGDKIIYPGDGHRSFLLRKCQNGLDYDNGIVPAEGYPMPLNQAPLSNIEVETIRQWILWGAKSTGVACDTAVIGKYYRGKGINNMAKHLPVPPPSQGFQVHYEPFFLPPKTEIERHLKKELVLSDSVEVIRLELEMNKKASHHFLLHMFEPGVDKNYAAGPRDLLNGSNSPLVQAWQTPYDVKLPQGTAYRWRKDAVLDQDFHCFNTNPDSVVATDIRFNVYTQPNGTAQAIMYSTIVQSLFFYIPNNNAPTTLTMNATFTDLPDMYLWTLSSHTHKYGIDFDIYKRKPGGGKDVQLFEGYYDFNYQFNQGYYDWQHPPIRHFEPLYRINPKDGLFMEAVYRNNGPKAVGFGATTEDEMFLMFVNYTIKGVTVGANDVSGKPSSALRIYPNPSGGLSTITYELKQDSRVKLELFNMLGEKITTLVDDVQHTGRQSFTLDATSLGCSEGIYFVRLDAAGNTSLQKLIITR